MLFPIRDSRLTSHTETSAPQKWQPSLSLSWRCEVADPGRHGGVASCEPLPPSTASERQPLLVCVSGRSWLPALLIPIPYALLAHCSPWTLENGNAAHLKEMSHFCIHVFSSWQFLSACVNQWSTFLANSASKCRLRTARTLRGIIQKSKQDKGLSSFPDFSSEDYNCPNAFQVDVFMAELLYRSCFLFREINIQIPMLLRNKVQSASHENHFLFLKGLPAKEWSSTYIFSFFFFFPPHTKD